jgi:hypothetical protein
MEEYSELVARPTDTEESIAVQDVSQHSDSPANVTGGLQGVSTAPGSAL